MMTYIPVSRIPGQRHLKISVMRNSLACCALPGKATFEHEVFSGKQSDYETCGIKTDKRRITCLLPIRMKMLIAMKKIVTSGTPKLANTRYYFNTRGIVFIMWNSSLQRQQIVEFYANT